MQSKSLQVDQWQAARRDWLYDPVLWFSYRMVEQAYLDTLPPKPAPVAEGVKAAPRRWVGLPSDEALLARDWIATSEPTPWKSSRSGIGDYVSFPECCERLGLNADVERMALLERIDAGGEFDTDEAWERLATLELSEPKDDVEALFEAFRVVPALDQLRMFVA